MDGVDLSAALKGTGPSPRDELFYYWDSELRAVRKGRYKAHFITSGAYERGEPRTVHDPPLLFDFQRIQASDSTSRQRTRRSLRISFGSRTRTAGRLSQVSHSSTRCSPNRSKWSSSIRAFGDKLVAAHLALP